MLLLLLLFTLFTSSVNAFALIFAKGSPICCLINEKALTFLQNGMLPRLSEYS